MTLLVGAVVVFEFGNGASRCMCGILFTKYLSRLPSLVITACAAEKRQNTGQGKTTTIAVASSGDGCVRRVETLIILRPVDHGESGIGYWLLAIATSSATGRWVSSREARSSLL